MSRLFRAVPVPTFAGGLNPVAGGQQLTVTAAAGVNLTVPAGATIAHIQAYDGNIRYRADGTAVTPTTGMCLFAAGDMWFANGLATIELISEAGNVEVNVLYYKPNFILEYDE